MMICGLIFLDLIKALHVDCKINELASDAPDVKIIVNPFGPINSNEQIFSACII
jgi:hypothetical protein